MKKKPPPGPDDERVKKAQPFREWQKPFSCDYRDGCWVTTGPSACAHPNTGSAYCLACDGYIRHQSMRHFKWSEALKQAETLVTGD
jgi:hypothetical protein